MSTPSKDIRIALAAYIVECASSYLPDLKTVDILSSFEIPREEKFGELATNYFLKAAKIVKKSPRTLTDELVKHMMSSLPSSILAGRVDKFTVEGPGFINIYFTAREIALVVSSIAKDGSSFGKPQIKSRKILLEYVSANPTGPLTVAHGRQAALGDSLARILRFCGHDLTTEYYNNDEGVQIQTLGKSTEHRVKELLDGQSFELPENFYRGEYLIDIAKKLLDKMGKDVYLKLSDEKKAETCRLFARDEIMRDIMKDLKEFDTVFDSFYSQEALGRSGKVETTLEELKKRGVVFESEGATWLRSTDFGDDKDRVLVKSDKNYTYLTPDIAYHHEKFKRGFEEIIDILGPDHHGYIARLKASQAALGHDPNCVRVLIAQLVTLYEADKQVRMSTRAGEFVTLRQILDEVGKDAGRFFFVMRKFDAHLDFDLALAKTQTPDNPVFYIQYAHARIESIKKTSVEAGIQIPGADDKCLARLVNEHEIRLMKLMSQFSDNVLGAERTLEPYRLVPYLMDLAASFHRFYTENRVVTEDVELSQARLLLILGAQQVIRTGLHLLGVNAPFKM